MQKVGEILKAEREKKGLSLHDIGMSLKINPKILKAIEDNDSSQLPAKTFLRGFVRSYAQFLHLDVQNILSLLQSEIGSTRPEELLKPQRPSTGVTANPDTTAVPVEADRKVVAVEKKKPLPPQSAMTGNRMLSILGAAILLLLIIFVAKMVDKYQRESQRQKVVIDSSQKLPSDEESLPPVNPDAPISSISPTPSPVLETLTTTPGPTAHPAETPIPTGTPTPSPTASPPSTPTPQPTPTPTPTATPIPVKALSPSPTPAASPPLAPAISPSPTPVATKAVEVIVEALNKVEIRYSFADDKYETITLLADELHTFKSKSGVKLEISDGGAVSLIINGRERGVPGAIGKPIKLSYPK